MRETEIDAVFEPFVLLDSRGKRCLFRGDGRVPEGKGNSRSSRVTTRSRFCRLQKRILKNISLLIDLIACSDKENTSLKPDAAPRAVCEKMRSGLATGPEEAMQDMPDII